MTTLSISMMIVAMLVIWGGLIASILYLRAKPENTEGLYEDPDLVLDDEVRAAHPHTSRDL